MTCVDHATLAAAASDEGRPIAIGCAHCAALVEDQRAIRALARALPVPALTASRRAALAAETLARADMPARRHARVAIAAGLAVAAGIVAVAWLHHDTAPPVPSPPRPAIATHAAPPAPIARTPAPPAIEVVPPPPPAVAPHVRPAAATIAARGADFSRDELADRDTVELRDGTLAIDARNRAPVAVVVGDTTFAIANGRAELVASGGVIVSAHVFAGSVERTTGRARATIVAGDVWTPPAGPKTSLAAFRAGWQALRDGRHADAIAAFALATDPVVAEDAAFWTAVAAERASAPDTRARYEAFLARFPDSTRADAARAALARLP